MVAPLLKLLRRYPPVRNAQLVRAGARRADVVRAVVPLLLGLRPIDRAAFQNRLASHTPAPEDC